jgi:hypothetical protein
MRLLTQEGKIILSQTSEEIDQQTQTKIRFQYSESDEYKLHRLAIEALVNGNAVPSVYVEYQNFVKQCVGEGKTIKQNIT